MAASPSISEKLAEMQRKIEALEREKEEERKRADQYQADLATERQLSQKTNLYIYMDAVHTQLHEKIRVNTNPKTTTQGSMTSPQGRLVPTNVRRWDDFEDTQTQIWDTMGTADPDFFLEPHFESIHFLQALGERIYGRAIGSEKDLERAIGEALEHPVTSILLKISENTGMAKALRLTGSVIFQNHGNGLDDDADEVTERLDNLDLATPTRNPKLNILTKFAGSSESNPSQSKGYMNADQICVQKSENGKQVPAFIIEYKPPHKLTLEMISVGLCDMDPYNDIVNSVLVQEDQDAAYAKLAVAAAITQTFDYMVTSRLQYGYICTGLAFIFLHIKEDDLTTVYYHLSIPKVDLTGGTRWQAGSFDPNLLHATALGRVAVFCLQALQKKQLTVDLVDHEKTKLRRWVKDYQQMLESIPETTRQKARSTPYKISRLPKESDLRNSPICLRSRTAATRLQCGPTSNDSSFQDKSGKDSDDEDDNDNDHQDARAKGSPRPPAKAKRSEPPSTKGARTGGQRSHCTQECLLGLLQQSQLDEQCPNIDDHRKWDSFRHAITRHTFLRLIQKQLGQDRDNDVEPWHVKGSRGMMFTVTLRSHGYTVAAKATTYPWVTDLRHEESVYNHLHELQGTHIPVCLGNIDLEKPYPYTARCILVHMMFLAYVGEPLSVRNAIGDVSDLSEQALNAIDALHRYGVSHRDVALRNMFWNEEINRVLFIDFERSVVFGPDAPEERAVLGAISHNANRKRKRYPKEQEKMHISGDNHEAANAITYKVISRNRFDKSPLYSCQDLFKSEVQTTSNEIASLAADSS